MSTWSGARSGSVFRSIRGLHIFVAALCFIILILLSQSRFESGTKGAVSWEKLSDAQLREAKAELERRGLITPDGAEADWQPAEEAEEAVADGEDGEEAGGDVDPFPEDEDEGEQASGGFLDEVLKLTSEVREHLSGPEYAEMDPPADEQPAGEEAVDEEAADEKAAGEEAADEEPAMAQAKASGASKQEDDLSHLSHFSILQRFNETGKLFVRPYPYIVINDALPEQLYRTLSKSFPSDEAIYELTALKYEGSPSKLNNKRVDIQARVGAVNRAVPKLWRDFVRYHTSQAFFEDVRSVFGRHLMQQHPITRKKCAPAAGSGGAPPPACPRVGMRFKDKAPVLMDCQIAINSPVSQESTVRGPHLDGAAEIYAGLFYLRHPRDTETKGGDLQVMRCDSPPCGRIRPRDRSKFSSDTQFHPRDMQVMNNVKYRPNQFVMFINGPQAIHSVTARKETPFSRRLVNIIAVNSVNRHLSFAKG